MCGFLPVYSQLSRKHSLKFSSQQLKIAYSPMVRGGISLLTLTLCWDLAFKHTGLVHAVSINCQFICADALLARATHCFLIVICHLWLLDLSHPLSHNEIWALEEWMNVVWAFCSLLSSTLWQVVGLPINHHLLQIHASQMRVKR